MTLRPTSSKRTRAYNIFVGTFFMSVILAMIAAGAIARGDWTGEQMLWKLAPFVPALLIGAVGAVAHYRGKGR